ALLDLRQHSGRRRRLSGRPHGPAPPPPRVPPRRLPPLLHRPAGRADRLLDADGSPVLARADPDVVAAAARADRHTAVRAHPALLDRVGRARGPAAPESAAHSY